MNNHQVGEDNANAILREEDVVTIRELAAAGTTGKELAAYYGVSQATVCRIITGAMWASVGGPTRPPKFHKPRVRR